ncbi:hypothetical protein [Aquirufa antheringensis]|uniref:hypothetical protein n=1 Tax=Aquirufa antheringensis TaxID=2516559 RepID=UPI0022A96D3E|nr:hypothetical protein [Aquirufa antheringensis]MCZ2490067.1 glycosyltransferase family 4 protein [Aquirufa antheringensis]
MPKVTVIQVDYKGASVISDRVILKPGNNNKFVIFLKKIKQILSNYLGIEVDLRSSWANASINYHSQLAFKNDVIISTFGPPACHIIASHFKYINPKLRWIADYRDLWSTSHLLVIPSFKRKKLIKKELNLVSKKADLLTTVSSELAFQLEQFLKLPVATITNGFDLEIQQVLENYSNFKIQSISNSLRIVYTGMIYENRRDPRLLFKVVDEIINENSNFIESFKIVFYGSSSTIVGKMVENNSYNNFVRCEGHLSRDLVFKEQKNSDFLLLLESGDHDAKGVLTGKIFEYIAMGRPIISLGSLGDSSIGNLLKDTGCGFCYENNFMKLKFDLINALNGIRPEWYQPNLKEIIKYSREKQANILFDIINEIS